MASIMSKWISQMSWTSIDAIGRRSPMMSVAFPALVAILVGFVWSIESNAQQVPEEEPITAEDREHWSFRPLTRPAVAAVKNTAWPRNAIDCFILTKIKKAGLRPMPATDRITLLRRVTFDLTGLPPTPAEIDAFLNDASANAYEQLVCSAPRHTENVGRCTGLIWRGSPRPTASSTIIYGRMRGGIATGSSTP